VVDESYAAVVSLCECHPLVGVSDYLYRFNIRRIVADLRFDVVGQCGEDRGLCLCASST
jgi:hypothetical protein